MRLEDIPDLKEGLCVDLGGEDLAQFYPEKGTAQTQAQRAKRVCNGVGDAPACPVRERCLEWALARGERYGIWGGLSERERYRERRSRAAEEAAAERRAEEERIAAEREREDRIRRRAAASRRSWDARRAIASNRAAGHEGFRVG